MYWAEKKYFVKKKKPTRPLPCMTKLTAGPNAAVENEYWTEY